MDVTLNVPPAEFVQFCNMAGGKNPHLPMCHVITRAVRSFDDSIQGHQASLLVGRL
jgi:hypothetical protein